MRVAVVGATGAAGSTMRSVLAERGFPVDEVRFMASSRSAGTHLSWLDHQVEVEDASKADYNGVDLVLMAAGKAQALDLAPKMAAAGAIVVDNSSAWRMDPDVPLVVPEVNSGALDDIRKGIVANPNCTTMVGMPVLWPIHKEAGLRRIVVSTYQAVSGGGLGGVRELEEQVLKTAENASALAWSGSAVDFPAPSLFPEPIAHNVISIAGSIVDDGSGETDEEKKFRNESRKILGIADLGVSCTCVRVPVFCGHSLALNIELERELSPRDALGLLAASPGVVIDDIPTPLKAAGTDPVIVGRVRRDPSTVHGLALFVSGDNLRKGAALNAVQIAEALIERNLLSA